MKRFRAYPANVRCLHEMRIPENKRQMNISWECYIHSKLVRRLSDLNNELKRLLNINIEIV